MTSPTPSSDAQVTTTPEVTAAGGTAPGRPLIERTLPRHALLFLLAFVGIVVLMETVGPFRVTQLASLAYYVPAVAGLTVLIGINGQISLGHGALMAVGAYTTAYLLGNTELPYLLVMLVSVLTATAVGALVGVAAARLHGPYLAGATLALAVGLPGIAVYFGGQDQLGGEQGLRVSPPQPSEGLENFVFAVTGNDLPTGKYVGYIGWILALIVLFLLSNLIVSRVGRTWRAVRDDEIAAELAGINLAKARVSAFVVSAACAGVAGSLLAVVTRLTAPTSFTIVLSITLVAAVVIGGLGSLVGAILGACLIVYLPAFVTNQATGFGLSQTQAAEGAPLTFGIVLIVVMLLAPHGAVGSIRRKYLERKATKQIAAARAAADG